MHTHIRLFSGSSLIPFPGLEYKYGLPSQVLLWTPELFSWHKVYAFEVVVPLKYKSLNYYYYCYFNIYFSFSHCSLRGIVLLISV